MFVDKRTTAQPCAIIVLCILILGGVPPTLRAQLVFEKPTPEELVRDVLLSKEAQENIKISNIEFIGDKSSMIAKFLAPNTGLQLDSGIILATGNVDIAKGPNNDDAASDAAFLPGWDALTDIVSQTTFDAAILRFDFIPSFDSVQFRYIFASEEYPEYVGQIFNDVFAFFVEGPGIPNSGSLPFQYGKNFALLNLNNPFSEETVSINNVNHLRNRDLFVSNFDAASSDPQLFSTIQYDGLTIPLSSKFAVIRGETYTISIAIADVADPILDSGIFLEANSFTTFRARPDIEIRALQDAIEGCVNGRFVIRRSPPLYEALTVRYAIGGTAVNGQDYQTIEDSVTIPAGEAEAVIDIISLRDDVRDDNERVTLSIIESAEYTIERGEDKISITELYVDVPEHAIVCPGDSVRITTRSNSPAFTYRWSPQEGLSDPNIQNPLAAPQQPTVYTVVATHPNGCIITDSIAITLFEPTADTEGLEMCRGEGARLSVSGGERYWWTPADGLDDPTSATPFVAPKKTTLYRVRIQAGTCTQWFDIPVTVNSLPQIEQPDDVVVCRNSSVTIGVEEHPHHDYSWSPTTGVVGEPDKARIEVAPESDTRYTVTVTDRETGCVTTADVSVIRGTAPIADAGADIEICLGENGFLEADGGVRYSWEPVAAIIGNPEARRIEIRPNETTLYTVMVYNEDGCASSATVMVTVLAGEPVDAGENITICEGETAILEAQGGEGHVWESDAAIIGDNVGQRITVRPDKTTVFRVRAEGVSVCGTAIDSVTVRVIDLPAVAITPPRTICLGESVTLQVQVDNPEIYTIEWMPGDDIDDPSAAVVRAMPSVSTDYMAIIHNGAACADTAFTHVEVIPQTEVRFALSSDDRPAFPNDVRTITLTVQPPDSERNDLSKLYEFRTLIAFDAQGLAFVPGSISAAQGFDGWRLEGREQRGGVLEISGRGEVPIQNDASVNFDLNVFLTSHTSLFSELAITEAVTNISELCAGIVTTDGGVTLSNFCIRSGRSIVAPQHGFALGKSLPNPAGTSMSIEFSVGFAAPVSLDVFDMMGRRVMGFTNSLFEEGTYRHAFDVSGLQPGVYYYRLSAGPFNATRRVRIVR